MVCDHDEGDVPTKVDEIRFRGRVGNSAFLLCIVLGHVYQYLILGG